MEFRPVCTMHAGKLCRFTCDQILEDGANTLTTTTHPSWLQVHSTVGSCTVLMPFRSWSIFYWPQAYVTVPQVQIFFVLLHKKRFLKDFAASVLELVVHCITFTRQAVCAKQETASLLLQLQQLRNFHWRITTEYCCKAPLVQYVITRYIGAGSLSVLEQTYCH